MNKHYAKNGVPRMRATCKHQEIMILEKVSRNFADEMRVGRDFTAPKCLLIVAYIY